MAIAAQTANRDDFKTYEVGDYVTVSPAKDYVLVRHYRTVRGAGGRITSEPLSSTEELIESMIRAFEGRAHAVSGTLNGFFPDPERARACAAAIRAHHGMPVDVSGTQISITL